MPKHGSYSVGNDAGRWYVNISARLSQTGKREKRYFSSQKKALAEAEKLRTQRTRFGVRGNMLPADLAADAAKAAAILEPLGVSLAAAANYYANAKMVERHSVSFAELCEHYLEAKPKLADRSVEGIRQADSKFDPYFSNTPVCAISAADIRAAFDAEGLPPSRRNAFKRILRALWNFAIRREFAVENPLLKIETEPVETGRPAVLSTSQSARLLRAAQRYETGVMLPYFALCLLAGLRPEEARRLTWGDIDIAKGHIHVPSGTAKTRTDRYVDIEPSLRIWLKHAPKHKQADLVCPLRNNDFRKKFDEVRIVAKVKQLWTEDIMRHTYCSNWLAFHNDQDRLLQMAGHSINTNLKHYRRAILKKKSIEFWLIVPEGEIPPELITAA